jgi:hypothetical protein
VNPYRFRRNKTHRIGVRRCTLSATPMCMEEHAQDLHNGCMHQPGSYTLRRALATKKPRQMPGSRDH